MVWALAAFAGAPWSAGTLSSTPSPGAGTLPPPIPGATTSFIYTNQSGSGPWAMRSWAGAMPIVANPGGGISVLPMPEAGVMRIWAWWPDVPALQIVRIGPDGTRTGVRGAYPIGISQTTRRNYATNPSVETGLNGYVPGTGSPTLTQIARSDDPTGGVSAWRATIAGAGTNEVTIPHSSPAQTVTVALDLRLSELPTAVTISLGWTNSTGGALTASSVALTPSQVASSVNQYSRHAVTLIAPVGAATAGSLKVTATGMTAGATMDGDRILVETGISAGAYFDGTTLGGGWTGVVHLSTSLLAPVQIVDDGECPLDVSVRYEAYNPAITGGRVASQPSMLESGERVWLTHPETPGVPVEVLVTRTPDVNHALTQSRFQILDSPYPVVVSTSTRLAVAGSLEFLVESFADRDRLIHDLFGNGTPVLWRTPDRYGYGEGEWIVLGDIVEGIDGGKPWDQLRTLRADFQVVERPADTLVS